MDPRVPVSFRLSLGCDLRCSAIGCVAVRTQPAPHIAASLEAKINVLQPASPVHEIRLSSFLAGHRPWILPTGSEPFGLLHHHRRQPPPTRARGGACPGCGRTRDGPNSVGSWSGQIRHQSTPNTQGWRSTRPDCRILQDTSPRVRYGAQSWARSYSASRCRRAVWPTARPAPAQTASAGCHASCADHPARPGSVARLCRDRWTSRLLLGRRNGSGHRGKTSKGQYFLAAWYVPGPLCGRYTLSRLLVSGFAGSLAGDKLVVGEPRG